MNTYTIEPIHPGEHLLEFIEDFEISIYRLSKDIGVPASRIDQITKGKRSITADTAIRLSLYFSNSKEFWMNLQSNFDLELASQSFTDTIAPMAV